MIIVFSAATSWQKADLVSVVASRRASSVARLASTIVGVIYVVQKLDEPSHSYAMKINLTRDSELALLWIMEASLLQRLCGNSHHFPDFIHSGHTAEGFQYIVMSLLGKSLDDLQYAMSDGRFSIGTTLRVGTQMVNVSRGGGRRRKRLESARFGLWKRCTRFFS